jgi:hypothetical protein
MAIDITPASMDMVARGRGGRVVVIDSDVSGIAQQITELHPDLFVRYNEDGEYFAVCQNMGAGFRPHVVTTSQTLDARLVRHVARLVDPSYDAMAEGDRLDAERTLNIEKEFQEKMGEVSERLAHSIRSDLSSGRPGPVYIPPDMYTKKKVFFPHGIQES